MIGDGRGIDGKDGMDIISVRKAQRLPWSETALTVSEWFNVLSGVQRLALQGFGERCEVIIPQGARSAALLSPERLCPFRSGSMVSQPSEILDFRLRREVIIP